MSERRKKKPALPTKQQVLEFIRESPTPVGKREIARAFGISGGDRIVLKAMLKEIAAEGEVERGRGRRLSRPAALPETAVVEITGVDVDGEVMARPLHWRDDAPPPKILMAPERRGAPALAAGDRVLAQLARTGDGLYEGRTIRQLAGVPQRVIGVYESIPGVGGRLAPTDRRVKTEYRIAANDAGGAKPGELVLAEVLHTHRLGVLQARVVERLGQFGEARTISLVSIHEHDIPTEFPRETLDLARAARPVALGERTDLRDVPLVTIDPEDARDHDDAVWAAPDDHPDNPGGFRLLVAIADVAHYVRPGDALDREAEKRGNSVYFPDRVVPMLPEEISNSLCSLRPQEERPCLAVELVIDREGKKLRHRFMRGLMRSRRAMGGRMT
jgi:ribonuclease R